MEPQETISALTPWRRGGGREIENAVPSCKRCRKLKGTRTLADWQEVQQRAAFIIAHDTTEVAEHLGLVRDLQRHLRNVRARHQEARRK